jgi:hypothetical protein
MLYVMGREPPPEALELALALAIPDELEELLSQPG